jgi:hypothetical protein
MRCAIERYVQTLIETNFAQLYSTESFFILLFFQIKVCHLIRRKVTQNCEKGTHFARAVYFSKVICYSIIIINYQKLGLLQRKRLNH